MRRGSMFRAQSLPLFAHSIVPLCFHQLLLVFRRKLRPVDCQRDLVDLPGEFEWDLIGDHTVATTGPHVNGAIQTLISLLLSHQRRLRLARFSGGSSFYKQWTPYAQAVSRLLRTPSIEGFRHAN